MSLSVRLKDLLGPVTRVKKKERGCLVGVEFLGGDTHPDVEDGMQHQDVQGYLAHKKPPPP